MPVTPDLEPMLITEKERRIIVCLRSQDGLTGACEKWLANTLGRIQASIRQAITEGTHGIGVNRETERFKDNHRPS